jgi:hypothetical protein
MGVKTIIDFGFLGYMNICDDNGMITKLITKMITNS